MPSVDWSNVTIDSVIDDIFRGASPLDMRKDDRLVVDALAREWRGQDASIQDAIGRSVARYLTQGNQEQRGLVLKFYELCSKAAGGEQMAALAKRGAKGFDDHVKNQTPGLIGDTLREALLYAAIAWNDGAAVDDALMDLVKEDILTGDGDAVLYDALRHAPDWFESHEDTLLALYPNAPSPVFRARIQRGMDPADALDSVLTHASARGRKRLKAAIRFDRKRLSADQRKALLEKLA